MSDYGSTPPPSQPSYGAQGAPGTPPPNYLVWIGSIDFSTWTVSGS